MPNQQKRIRVCVRACVNVARYDQRKSQDPRGSHDVPRERARSERIVGGGKEGGKKTRNAKQHQSECWPPRVTQTHSNSQMHCPRP
eukprot:1154560-Pelagomonas_calceolata.AAC.9